LTRVEARVLTPEYASPEQILGEPVTQSTDVYALGVLLYELLSGAKPFRATPASSQQSLRTMCETTPAEPSRAALAAGDRERSARLAGDLDRIVMKAIRREPERRYETVRDLAEDVRNYRAGRPVSARAPSWSYRTAKFIRRNRTAVAASVTNVNPPTKPQSIRVIPVTRSRHRNPGVICSSKAPRRVKEKSAGNM